MSQQTMVCNGIGAQCLVFDRKLTILYSVSGNVATSDVTWLKYKDLPMAWPLQKLAQGIPPTCVYPPHPGLQGREQILICGCDVTTKCGLPQIWKSFIKCARG